MRLLLELFVPLADGVAFRVPVGTVFTRRDGHFFLFPPKRCLYLTPLLPYPTNPRTALISFAAIFLVLSLAIGAGVRELFCFVHDRTTLQQSFSIRRSQRALYVSLSARSLMISSAASFLLCSSGTIATLRAGSRLSSICGIGSLKSKQRLIESAVSSIRISLSVQVPTYSPTRETLTVVTCSHNAIDSLVALLILQCVGRSFFGRVVRYTTSTVSENSLFLSLLTMIAGLPACCSLPDSSFWYLSM